MELFFTPENAVNLLSAAAQADLGQWMIKLTIVWFVVNGKFKKHFGGMETAMLSLGKDLKEFKTSVTKSVEDLTEALGKLEKAHSGRIDSVDERVSRLSARITDLEKK